MSRRRRDPGIDGVAIVDKAPGWTSHDVVAKARHLLGTGKVGHAGTLDPDATGVLVLGVGRATRLMRFLTPLGKSYVGEMVLGTETTTLDAAGEVTAVHDMSGVTPDEVVTAAAGFVGRITQVPPMVSAVKVGGRRLHELAREGIEVERPERQVTVSRLVVGPVAGEPGVYRLEVDCSSGTYIRTLAADLGAALGGGAHLRSLRRTAVGSFTLEDARPLESLDQSALLPVAAAVRDLTALVVDEEIAGRVVHGAQLDLDAFATSGEPPWAVVGPDGALLAVYEPQGNGRAKPAVVVARVGG